MKRIGTALALTVAVSLAGCGGGGSSSSDARDVVVEPSFLVWSGSGGGDEVIDADSKIFAFYADSGCLFNFQTGRENTAFCLQPGTNLAAYGPFRGQVLNVRAADGACVAALIDDTTGNFADIEVDSFGREVVLLTELRPSLCPF